VHYVNVTLTLIGNTVWRYHCCFFAGHRKTLGYDFSRIWRTSNSCV